MDNVLYEKTLVPADHRGDIGPTKLYVTKETNCYAVWVNSDDELKMVKWFKFGKSDAIEFGVNFAAEFLKTKV